MKTYRSHPVALMPNWLAGSGADWYGALSIYKYSPQEVKDERKVISVKLSDLSSSTLENYLGLLPPGHELAMHSDLSCNGKKLHIPMIDFASGEPPSLTLLDWLKEYSGVEFVIFESGRSYHGYGLSLLSHDAWVSLMGLLLLCNKPHSEPAVDSRWVGHRLRAGYSALRWSYNTSSYLKLPNLVSS